MANAESGPSFYGIVTFRDLFWKSQNDWHRLHDSDQQKRSYALFDLVSTLNHMWEWFLKDETIDIAQRVECARRFNPYEYRKWVPREFMDFYETLCPFPPKNELQSLVRMICNRAKHATNKPKLSTIKTEAYLGGGDPRAFMGSPVAVLWLSRDCNLQSRGNRRRRAL